MRNSSASRFAFFSSSCSLPDRRSLCLGTRCAQFTRDLVNERFCLLKSVEGIGPVTARMRRVPEAMDSSLVILNRPMSPVARTCVPPQSSFENASPSTSPGTVSTRTCSAYFSPNRAIAPDLHRFFERARFPSAPARCEDVIVDEPLNLGNLVARQEAESA